jgi:hypothetical protein
MSELTIRRASEALLREEAERSTRLSRAAHALHVALRSRPLVEFDLERRLRFLEHRLEAAMNRLAEAANTLEGRPPPPEPDSSA